MKNKQTGITLIALVITIIILLILAGITINALGGENGLLAKAKWSAYVSEYESVDEAKELYRSEKEIDKYSKETKSYEIASTSTIIAPNNIEDSIYPVDLEKPLESSNISETLKKAIMDLEGLKDDEINDVEKVNLYQVDFSKINAKAKKDYVINIVNGNLYSLQYEEYNGNFYHTPRLGVAIIENKMEEVGNYEIIVDAGDTVSWDSIQIAYKEFIENSLTCKIYTSDDEVNWKEQNLELVNYEGQIEKYDISTADNSQFLKIRVEIKSVDGNNSKVDYLMTNFYKFRDTGIVPEVTAEGAEKQNGVYCIPTPSNGQTEATGTATVVQKIVVPDDGEFLLELEDVYGSPNTTVKITKTDGTEETINITDASKISVPAGATVVVTTELEAGDGIGEIKVLKKDSEPSQKKIENNTKTESGQAGWVTVEQSKYVYNNGGTGFWEKCLVNDIEVDETGIIIESEDAVKRIRIRYQTSDGNGWSSTFTNIQDALNTQYLKVIVEYQVIEGNEYGDTSNNKIKVILNDGSWKATFLDEDGTELLTNRVYFENSNKQATITLPNLEKTNGEKEFLCWKIDSNIHLQGSTYTVMQDTTFTAYYFKMNIYTVEDLCEFRDAVNSGITFEGKTVHLMNDLDLSSICYKVDGTAINDISWVPIGTNPFKGIFDGNNKTITRLYVNSNTDYQGLFGIIENGTVKNLNIEGTVGTSENSYIGLLAGKFSGVIENVNTVKGSSVIGKNNVGGMVGILITPHEVSNSSNSADVTASGDFVGGLCGTTGSDTSNIIRRCSNNGSISGNGGVGGIAGWSDSEILESYNNASVQGTAGYIGGIYGASTGGNISYCYNKGDIQGYGNDGTGYTSVGGIIGAKGKVMYCYNTGNIYGEKGQAGGIMGNSYNNGSNSVQYSYNTGSVSGGNRANGSIIGEGNNSSINYCYWISSNNGIGYRGTMTNSRQMTEAELKAYTNDFFVEDTDSLLNDGYPILKWQVQE